MTNAYIAFPKVDVQVEIFDPTPYAEALTRYFLRHRLSGSLPRKFKIAFEGCREDHAVVSIVPVGIDRHRRVVAVDDPPDVYETGPHDEYVEQREEAVHHMPLGRSPTPGLRAGFGRGIAALHGIERANRPPHHSRDFGR